MQSHWLIPGLLGTVSALVMTLPAEAAQLQSWWFDARTNRLTFTTDTGVQPRAQMLFNPTRIVVDLPGTTLGPVPDRQAVGGAVREVRVGQFDAQTARLVIELSPNYRLTPQQVQVQGLRANQWMVQFAAPELATGASTPSPNPNPPPNPGSHPNVPNPNVPNPNVPNTITGQSSQRAAAQLEGIVATGDGFLVQVSGTVPAPTVTPKGRNRSDRQIIIDLPNTAIAPSLQPTSLPINRYSVTRWELTQLESAPPTTRLTLTLGEASPDWRVLSNRGGLVLLPPRGVAISAIPDHPPPPTTQAVTPAAPSRPIPVAPPTTSRPTIPPPTPQPTTPALPRIGNERVVVVIDPGHGGVDPGAVGIRGLQEKQVIFPICLRVRELLEAQGVTVVMTRTQDITLDLQPRVDIAERANGDLFVSIHANAISMSRPDVNGIESYYATESSRRLAATIHASMLAATGMNDRGVKEARFYVIRRTSMPATLLEIGFVTGAQDAPRLADPVWREMMANAIARGILQYIQENF